MPLRIIMPSITVAAQDGAALRLSGGEAHWRAIAHGSLSQVAAKHVALLVDIVGGHGRSSPAALPGTAHSLSYALMGACLFAQALADPSAREWTTQVGFGFELAGVGGGSR